MKFMLQFNAGIIIENPGSRFRAPDDCKFELMTTRFRDTVAAEGGRLLEIGSRARSGTSYRQWFPDIIDYVGIDIADGPNVDVVGDAHHLSRYVPSGFRFAFSIAVFEHLLMPWKVAIEMSKVLNMGGRALIISHAAWPLHEEPWDYFRFSVEAWTGLFNKHTGFRIVESQYQYPAVVVPAYANAADQQVMTLGRTYLLSGCVIEKIGTAKVEWDAELCELMPSTYSY